MGFYQHQAWKIDLGARSYDGIWFACLLVTCGLLSQFFRDYTKFNNFVIDVINWIAADGIAIVFSVTVLPKFYDWLEKKEYIQRSIIII